MSRRRRTGPQPTSAATHQHSTKIVKGVVQSVDPTTWTCTVTPIGGGVPIEGVPVAPQSVGADGQGSFFMPETNTPVWLCRPSDEASPFIIGGATLPTQLDQDDDEENPNDHRMNRPVLGEGDHMMAGPGGSPFVILRKGGSLEIGSTQTAQRIYLPLQDTIREFFSNLEQNAAGGKLEWKTRTDDPTHGASKNPVEFRLQVKEFSDEDPMIDIGLGRILEEDGQAVTKGDVGDIVARLLINDAYQVWIDKEGNFQRTAQGSVFDSVNGKRVEFVASDWVQVVRGNESRTVGARSVRVDGEDRVTSHSRKEQINGSLEQIIAGIVNTTTGQRTEEIKGSWSRNVQGGLRTITTGPVEETIGEDRVVSVGGGSKEIVGGRRSVTVANHAFASGELVGDEVSVNLGDLTRHVSLGNIKLTGGPLKRTPLAEIRINGVTGVIALRGPIGIPEIQINPTGIRLKTAAGEISLDQAGQVKLGPPGRGNVVTTLTHPVCFVTGAPIMGSTFVSAGGAPPAPGPDAVPSTFVDQVLV